MKKAGGMKHDGQKPPFELLTKEFLEGTARVLGFGAKKYASWNWAKGIEFLRLFGAIQRHLWAWHSGEDLDPESGLPHLDHALCEMQFLRTLVEKRSDLDNRHRWSVNEPPSADVSPRKKVRR